MKVDKCKGIVYKDAHVYRKLLKGKLKNEDTWLA
jgi:hypothetical protein